MILTFANWIRATPLGLAANGGVPWIWPLCETLHFFGLALLVGVVGLLDLRMLGWFKELPIAPLQRLIPWAIFGFAINLTTGFIFFAGNPLQYINNPAFGYKLLFILLAGVNVLVFYVSGLNKRVDAVGANESVPTAAKVTALVSLTLWIGVMYWGRMLPFIGNSF